VIRDALAAAAGNKRRYATVQVKGIDGLESLRIQSLTAREKIDVETQILTKRGTPDIAKAADEYAAWIIATVVDENGYRVLTEDDREWVLQLDDAITSPLIAAIRAHVTTIADEKKSD
jgi:hypothetical protein